MAISEDEANPDFWQTTRQARWVNLSRSRFPTLVPQKKVFPVAL